MNNYHIYEEIGKGKYSIVYKGRKKKSIEYVAVKSLEKSRRKKVLNEVKILANLNHNNILKFYNWYETRNHLWMIFEYCSGGDLLALIEQDKQLPENVVRYFGRDIAQGLQFLHSNGIINCDLKPANILLTENGELKLYDFGLARKIVDMISEDNNQASSNAPSKQGTPHYMAPELFEDNGIYTFQSDLWAFGCVLYELAVGHPPFVSTSFTELVTFIVNAETPQVPGFSQQYNLLLKKLLEKDPSKRATWDQVINCSWFSNSVSLNQYPLPQQPHFETWKQLQSEKGENNKQQFNNTANMSSRSQQQQQQQQQIASKTTSSPNLMQEQQQQQQQLQQPINQIRKQWTTSDAQWQEKVLRLSGIVKTNQLKEVNQLQYQAKENKTSDVELTNRRDVIDLGKKNNDDDDFNDATDSNNMNIEEGFYTEAPQEQHLQMEQMKKLNLNKEKHKDNNKQRKTLQRDETNDQDQQQEFLTPATQKLNYVMAQQAQNTPKLIPLEQLLPHNSDIAVKPITGNREIEKIQETKYNAETLPYKIYSLDEIAQGIDSPSIENYFAEIYNLLGKASNNNDKLNQLNYFEGIIQHSNIANRLINSVFMNLLLKLCKSAKSPNLKIRICSIIGILIRHATVIENELSKLGIPNILLDCMKEKNDKVKRKAISALGEYLFYGATQLDEDPQQNSMWELPNQLLQNIVKYLKLSEDEITRFYLCKTIENITAQSQLTSQKFATLETMNQIILIFQNTKLEELRTCTSLCLQNLTRLNYDLLPILLLDKFGVRTLNIILRDHNQRIQQSLITMLNQFFYVGGNSGIERLILPSQDSPILLTRLLALLETQHPIIRGKVIIGLVILLRAFPTLLTIIATNKFFNVLEKLARDQSKYLFSCLQHLLGFLEEMIPNLLISVHQELLMLTEEYSQGNQEFGQGNNASTVVQQQQQQQQQQHPPTYLHNPQNPKSTLTNNLSFIQLIFLFTNSPLFKFSIMSKEYLSTIFTFLDLSENLLRCLVNQQQQLSQQLEEFRAYLFLIFESFTTTPKLLDMHYEMFTSYVLPQLFSYINTKNPDLRFHCLKLFTDLSLNLISTEQSNPKLNQLLISEVLPELKKVLLDQEPMPLYALKLLNILLEKNPPTFTKCLIELGYFQLLMSFYNYQNSRLTSNTLKLIAKIILSNDLSIESLQKQFEFFQKTVKIVISLYQNQQFWAYEDIVEILFNFFLKIVAPMNSSKIIQTIENSVQPLFISNEIAMQLKVQQFDTILDIIPIIYQIFASQETAIGQENCADFLTLLIFIYGNSVKNDQFLQSDPISLIFPSLIDPNKSILQAKLLKILYWILFLAQGTQYMQQIPKKEMIIIFLQTLKNSENKMISALAIESAKLLM